MKRLTIILVAAVYGIMNIPALACTTAIISAERSGTGRPLLWKQRDTKNEYNHIAYIEGEKYSFTALIASTSRTPKNAWAGANEKGFVIANNVSYNINPSGTKGAGMNGAVMMQALGVCATVDEFEQFLKDMPCPRNVHSNYAVIDAAGGAAYFEVGNDRYHRFDVKDSPSGYLYRTNFSIEGYDDKGKGYIRYEAAGKILGEKGDGFTPSWIFDNLARSFYHGLLKSDLKDKKLREFGEGFVMFQDYIPRFTTTASIVFEGVNPGEDPRNLIMWNVIGFPPSTYAIPVWVGAGDEIPACLFAEPKEKAPANRLAVQLKNTVFPIKRGSGDKYLDYLTLRKEIIPHVASSEKKEFAEAEKLKKEFAEKGFSLDAVRKFNIGADKRFKAFQKKMKTVVKPE